MLAPLEEGLGVFGQKGASLCVCVFGGAGAGLQGSPVYAHTCLLFPGQGVERTRLLAAGAKTLGPEGQPARFLTARPSAWTGPAQEAPTGST